MSNLYSSLRCHMHKAHTATFRFYEELNDFLPAGHRKQDFEVPFDENPAVKDTIEALGVPHTEVDLIIVNGVSVDFSYQLQTGDRVAVYPVFESLDIQPLNHLRPKPLRDPRFILDVHLGKLARWLRILGFDCLYENDYRDSTIVALALRDRRIILTRDRGILKRRSVTHGYCVRSDDYREQLREVIQRFQLEDLIMPFRRCPLCNASLEAVNKTDILGDLEKGTAASYDEFYRCSDCGQIYWEGSHVKSLRATLTALQTKS